MFVPTAYDILIYPLSDSNIITYSSKELNQAQGEWDLVNITYSKSTVTRWIDLDQLIYQVQSRTHGMESKPRDGQDLYYKTLKSN